MTNTAGTAPAADLEAQILELEKTIRDHGRTYPDQIAAGTLEQAEADRRLTALRRVHTQLMWLDGNRWALDLREGMADAEAARGDRLKAEIEQLEWELRDRRRIYPHLEAKGRQMPATSAVKLAAVTAALDTVKWLARAREWIRDEAERRKLAAEAADSDPIARQVLKLWPGSSVRIIQNQKPGTDQ